MYNKYTNTENHSYSVGFLKNVPSVLKGPLLCLPVFFLSKRDSVNNTTVL